MGFDGDAALPLEVHGVQNLRLHLPGLQGAGDFEEAVGQSRLAVVDVGDDRKVTDVLLVHLGEEEKSIPALTGASLTGAALQRCSTGIQRCG